MREKFDDTDSRRHSTFLTEVESEDEEPSQTKPTADITRETFAPSRSAEEDCKEEDDVDEVMEVSKMVYFTSHMQQNTEPVMEGSKDEEEVAKDSIQEVEFVVDSVEIEVEQETIEEKEEEEMANNEIEEVDFVFEVQMEETMPKNEVEEIVKEDIEQIDFVVDSVEVEVQKIGKWEKEEEEEEKEERDEEEEKEEKKKKEEEKEEDEGKEEIEEIDFGVESVEVEVEKIEKEEEEENFEPEPALMPDIIQQVEKFLETKIDLEQILSSQPEKEECEYEGEEHDDEHEQIAHFEEKEHQAQEDFEQEIKYEQEEKVEQEIKFGQAEKFAQKEKFEQEEKFEHEQKFEQEENFAQEEKFEQEEQFEQKIKIEKYKEEIAHENLEQDSSKTDSPNLYPEKFQIFEAPRLEDKTPTYLNETPCKQTYDCKRVYDFEFTTELCVLSYSAFFMFITLLFFNR